MSNEINLTDNHHEMNTANLQFLTFTVGKEEYGIDIMTVREIKGWVEPTRLPNTPECMRGVINLRGLIIPIFDLRVRFGGNLTEATPKNVVIILAAGERTIGILVDTVSDIINTTSEAIKPAPTHESAINEAFVNGLFSLNDRMVVLLNIELLFDHHLLHDSMETVSN